MYSFILPPPLLFLLFRSLRFLSFLFFLPTFLLFLLCAVLLFFGKDYIHTLLSSVVPLSMIRHCRNGCLPTLDDWCPTCAVLLFFGNDYIHTPNVNHAARWVSALASHSFLCVGFWGGQRNAKWPVACALFVSVVYFFPSGFFPTVIYHCHGQAPSSSSLLLAIWDTSLVRFLICAGWEVYVILSKKQKNEKTPGVTHRPWSQTGQPRPRWQWTSGTPYVCM